MKTNVRIPKYLEKYLTIASFLIALIGFLSIVAINGLQSSDVFDVQAGMPWAGGEYTNICGSGEAASHYDPVACPALCNTGSGSCSPRANPPGDRAIRFTCDGWTTRCEQNGQWDVWGMDTGSGTCNKTQQVDVLDANGGLIGYLVWWHPCDEPETTTTTTEQPRCEYSSTQARVRENSSSNWTRELRLMEGESFEIGSFHNGNFNNYARNTTIRVEGPSGFSFTCHGNDASCNGRAIVAAAAGTYTVTVGTRKPGGGYFTEAACRGQASVFADNGEPNFTITKTVRDGVHRYDPGDRVLFDIVITNTGNITIEQLEFIDRFDPRYLDFVLIRHGNNHLTSVSQINNVDNTTREIIIDDLTEHVGDISPGESVTLVVRFTARHVTATVRTINYAIADDGRERKEDDDWVEIIVPDIPPTDM